MTATNRIVGDAEFIAEAVGLFLDDVRHDGLSASNSSAHLTLETDSAGRRVTLESGSVAITATVSDASIQTWGNEGTPQKTDRKKKKKAKPITRAKFTPEDRTVMMRNIPNRYTPEELLAEVEEMDFSGKFNFMYVPMDFANKVNMGYAFINFTSYTFVMEFCNVFNKRQLPLYTTTKILEIVPAETQGYAENVLKFLKGAARRIHNQFFRPWIFKTDGISKDFQPMPLIRENLLSVAPREEYEVVLAALTAMHHT